MTLWGLVDLTAGIGTQRWGLLLVWLFLVPAVASGLAAGILITYPGCKADTPRQRVFLQAVTLTVGLHLLTALVSRPDQLVQGCSLRPCPANPLRIPLSSGLWQDCWLATQVATFGVAAWLVIELVIRYRGTSTASRRSLTPILVATVGPLTGLMMKTGLRAGQVASTPWWTLTNWWEGLTRSWIPVAMAVGLLASRLARADIACLLVELRTTGIDRIGAAVARVLGDPFATVAIPIGTGMDGAARYSGLDGRPPHPPTDVAAEITPLAGGFVLLSQPATRQHDPQLFDAVAEALRLALDNARLVAQAHTLLAEVTASRERLVAAGDDTRRRLERDLHDGAQQRLIGVGVTLRSARSLLDGGTPAATLLDQAVQEVRESLTELRELARGLSPTLLAQRGLEPTLRGLLHRAKLPFSLDVRLPQRPPPAVETTVYYVVAEAVQNVTRHAPEATVTVTVRDDGRALTVEVRDTGGGGARPSTGSGLQGLQDRVAAFGGSLTIRSPHGVGTTLTAVLPPTAGHRGFLREVVSPGPDAAPAHPTGYPLLSQQL